MTTTPPVKAQRRRARLLRRGAQILIVSLLAVVPLTGVSRSSAEPLQIDRSAGSDRIATAVAISKTAWPNGATSAVLARSDTYPDALAAAPLAAALNAPLLLTPPDRLDGRVGAELSRLGVDKVVLLGQTSALSKRVADQVRALGTSIKAQRIAGQNRFATAEAIAQELERVTGKTASSAYVARATDGLGWADALAAAPLAGRQGLPLLLADQERLPYAAARLANYERLTFVGGTSVLGTKLGADLRATRSRVSGANRYETAIKVAEAAIADLRTAGRLDQGLEVWISTGANFPDALAAGAAIAKRPAVLLLAPPRWQGSATQQWVAENAAMISEVRLLGASQVVPEDVEADLGRLSGFTPGGATYTYQLMYSTRSDFANAKPLQGATVSGDIYVFLARCDSAGRNCTFEF